MQKSKLKIKIQKFILVFCLAFLPLVASAAITNIWEGTGGGTTDTTCNIKPYHCTICDGAIITVNIIELLLALGVVIAVLMTLYGGFRLITAGGSQTQISQGKGIIVNAIVGLVIISCSWLIVATVFNILTTKTDWNVLDIIGCQSGNLAEKAWKNATKGQSAGNNQQTGNEAQIINESLSEEEIAKEELLNPSTICGEIEIGNGEIEEIEAGETQIESGEIKFNFSLENQKINHFLSDISNNFSLTKITEYFDSIFTFPANAAEEEDPRPTKWCHFYQFDPDIADIKYPSRDGICYEDDKSQSTVKTSGCALVSTLMVMNAFSEEKFTNLKEETIEILNYMKNNGYRVCNYGTNVAGIRQYLIEEGLKIENLGTDFNDINKDKAWKYLERGWPVIAGVADDGTDKCKFTEGGHYIVFLKKNGNTIKLLDPVKGHDGYTWDAKNEPHCNIKSLTAVYKELDPWYYGCINSTQCKNGNICYYDQGWKCSNDKTIPNWGWGCIKDSQCRDNLVCGTVEKYKKLGLKRCQTQINM